jgi:hypothetical protein
MVSCNPFFGRGVAMCDIHSHQHQRTAYGALSAAFVAACAAAAAP